MFGQMFLNLSLRGTGLAPERSLLDHVALWQDLEDLLGRKVDLVSEKALHRLMRDQILKEAVPL